MYTGLTTSQSNEILKRDGYNEIPEKKVGLLQKIIKSIVSPIALMLILASILSFFLGKTFDGYFILILLSLNIAITLWQEGKADNAIKKLNEHLAQRIKVYRDEKWQYINSRELVAGDVIQLGSGEVIPADGKILEASHVSANESALTGESLPKDKNVSDEVFSGSFISTGLAVVEVSATGAKTHFGKTLFSVEQVRKRSLLEQDIISISRFLTILSLIAVVILTVVFLLKNTPFLELMTLDLSLIIAGIPISLPTVMTLIIEFGVLNLAKKRVIVRRLSALEDLANVNFVLTDKTGTLTENKIEVQQLFIYGSHRSEDLLFFASIIASSESDNPIDSAILEKVKKENIAIPHFTTIDFTPADSKRKRSTIVVTLHDKDMVISMGAPQIIVKLCHDTKRIDKEFEENVKTLAYGGFRALAVAVADGSKEEKMQLIGLISLSDVLRHDAKSVIQFLGNNGIGVAMVTGDNRAIAQQVAHQLSLGTRDVVTKEELDAKDWDSLDKSFFQNVGSFAEVLPEDKFHLVEKAKSYFVVAANGDGVNDLPAIKAANVGIAVKTAVSALKSTADIVLLSEGISVIKDAIIESRKIFERIYTYSLYRISESVRLIITIAILGLAYGLYPLTALQIILIALLNDIPIISLAFDNVKIAARPAKIDAKSRFILSSLFGLTGVATSLLLFYIVNSLLHLEWGVVQTMFFLKLTVSGHLLIYVAHTKERWWKFLPSKQVILATAITQLIATLLALTGFLMPGRLTLGEVVFVWIWSLLWMQVSEVMKIVHARFIRD